MTVRIDELIEAIPDAVIVLAPVSARLLAANDLALVLYGYERDHMLSLCIRDLRAQEAQRSLADQLAAAEASITRFETVHRRKDGIAFPVEVSSRGVHLGGERVLLSVVRDLTLRKRAEDNLREQEARWRATFDQAFVGVAHVGLDGRWLRVNQRLCDMLGYTPDEMLARTLASVTHPDHVAGDAEAIRRMIAGEQQEYVCEKRYLRKDGSSTWAALATRLLRTERGEPLYFNSFVLDISQRKAAEEQLEVMKTAIDRSLQAAYWFDPAGRLIYVNDAGCEALGYERSEMAGMNLWDIAPAGSPETWPEVFSAIRDKGSFSADTHHRRKDGTLMPVHITSWYLRYGDREYVPGFAVDLTDRQRAEQERIALEQQLHHAQRLESIGRLAGGIAHDFNNLLSVMLGNVETLEMESAEGSPQSEALADIRRAGDRAAGLVRQLLAFSRKQVLIPKIFNLDVAVADVKKMLARVLKGDVTVEHLRSKEQLFVEADRGQVDQILLNLAVNAGDAMPNGGSLYLQVLPEAIHTATGREHMGLPAGDYVALLVRDTGTGIAPDILPRIFDPFFTTKTVGKGTGLGLSTVYGIVKQSRGDVSVFSEPGRGTTFKVLLPRVPAPVERAASSAPAKSKLRGRGTILVAEDDDSLRSFVRRALESFGFTVLEASNGLNAEGVFDDLGGDIDLLLTDLIMPVRGGIDLAERLRARAPTLKVLLMSGYADDEDLPHHTPDHPFLHKPFGAKELFEKVQEVLASATVVDPTPAPTKPSLGGP